MVKMVTAIKVWCDYPYSLLWIEITMNKYIILFCQNTSTQNKQQISSPSLKLRERFDLKL